MLVPVAVALVVGVLGWTYQALKPPPPKICGSPNGPPVTSPRVKLSDGRHLAYREAGVSKEESSCRIIVVHGFDASKDTNLSISRELIEEKGLYLLFFDRAGYGESDPNPSRTVKSDAFDIQELADLLQIGSKFYLIGVSLGAYPVWACLHYLPHRLAGVSLVVPFVHYWWPSFPSNLSTLAFNKLKVSDQWAFRVAHYTPWLLDWWITQKWFPSLSMMAGSIDLFTPTDLLVLNKLRETPTNEKVRQQGIHESLIRDLKTSFGRWEFGPLDVKNPFREGGGSVHLWQGYEDRIIPFEISRYITEKLPWIQYHEIRDRGHFFMVETSFCEAIVMALLQ